MEKMIAFCGLNCTGCDAFPANRNKMTSAEKKHAAEKWSELYSRGRTIKPEEMECDGCLSMGGKLWNRCRNCEVRKCGMEKQVKNCAYCRDYPCEKLNEIFVIAPLGKDTLEIIRKSK
ncbi:MAG: DUF3795 domain-containing protein [Dehalococcoidales bacterium]|jgi:hypothetical protein